GAFTPTSGNRDESPWSAGGSMDTTASRSGAASNAAQMSGTGAVRKAHFVTATDITYLARNTTQSRPNSHSYPTTLTLSALLGR
ncbi:MAG: hypothetical protein RLZ55_528, partial [Actinomycetota bacterium]